MSANYKMRQPCHTDYDLLVILGPTATGKTRLAVQLADKLEGEIISADSRQVYLGMDIGTGKDLKEYELKGVRIPYHLIDIANPQKEYNVFQFQKDFQQVFTAIQKRQKLPILCGGTGFYIKAILMDFQMPIAEPNKKLRQKLETREMEDLVQELESISPGSSQNNPLDTKRRAIRTIEVEMSRRKKSEGEVAEFLIQQSKIKNPIVFGVKYSREIIRKKINKRLKERLDQGLIEEVEILLNNGITHERLESFGLEYRFISRYLQGQLPRKEMIEILNTAIHQFAKKQMTFFRHMERNGIKIHWIPEGNLKNTLDLIRSN